MLIYAIRNAVNNKCYIGQAQHSLEQRWKKHVNDAKRGSNFPIHRAIRKHGPDKFQRMVIFYAKDIPEMNAAETTYILAFRTNEPERGYNCTLGGDGMVSWKPTEETRRKLRKALLGKPESEERRRKKIGRKHSGETRQKMSEAHRGRPKSEETRLNMATAKRTKPGMLCPAPWLPRGAKF